MLLKAKNEPDVNKYLATLLVSSQQPSVLSYTPLDYATVRYSAGLTLKNNFREMINRIPEDAKRFVRQIIFFGLQDEDAQVRRITGSVITELVKRAGILSWKELLPELVSRIENSEGRYTIKTSEGAMSALVKVCDDNTSSLERNYEGSKPLDYLLPKLLSFTSSPSTSIRRDTLTCIICFLPQKSAPIADSLDTILSNIFSLATDPDFDVRTQICRALGTYVEIAPEKLYPQLQGLVDYLIAQQLNEDDKQLALAAAEFWLSAGEQDNLSEQLTPYLPKVVPVLLRCMVYSEEDAIMLSSQADDADEDDKAEDIKPQFAKSKASKANKKANEDDETGEEIEKREKNNMEDDEDLSEGEIRDIGEDGDEEEGEWTLRKCAAAALDVFSTRFHGKLFEVTLPYFTENLKHSEWQYREAAVLALGAVAEGCLEIVVPHLPELIPYLLSLLNDPEPLVRQITCWTLGRYATWAAHLKTPEEKQQYFVPMMEGLLVHMLDNKKSVQGAAASAFAYLEEQAEAEIVFYSEPIIRQFVQCFTRYKDKNMYVLYDCVQTLAKYAGEQLQRPELSGLLMPALINRWNMLSDESRELFPLFECLSYVVTALGTHFSTFAPAMYSRAIRIIHSNLDDDIPAELELEIDESDKDFLVTSLDLISSIVQALEPAELVTLINSNTPNLLELIVICLGNIDSDVRQSAYALLGDTAIYLFPQLQPFLPKILPVLTNQLDLDQIPDVEVDNDFDVVTNACWSFGEIVLRQPTGLEAYADKLTERFIEIMSREEVPQNCQENAAIALGRLAISSASVIAPHLPAFADVFLQTAKDIAPTEEKDSAFQGFALVVAQNPQSMENSLGDYFKAIAKYKQPSAELAALFHNVSY
jgi:transportin-1